MRAGTVSVLDFNPGASSPSAIYTETSSPDLIGSDQTFVGSRDGKFIPRQLRLNPVRIARVTGTAATVNLRTFPEHPRWGTRKWQGELGPVLFKAFGYRGEPYFPGDHEIRTDLQDAALQKAYSNISKADFDAQLFIAELGETVAMLRNPLLAFKKFGKLRKDGYLFNTRTGKIRYVPSSLRATMDLTADTYLQTVFGIVPLVTEVMKAYKAYKTLVVKSSFLRARGKRTGLKNKYIQTRTLRGYLSATSLTWALRLNTEHSTFARIYYAPKWDAALTEMVRKWGINPLEVPITAWRVYPLSFVFDWFICVSDWLEAVRPRPEVTLLGNCVSETFTEEWNIDLLSMTEHVNTYPETNYSIVVPGANVPIYTQTRRRLIRVVNLPTPTGLHWGNGINSVGKLVSSTMLTWQKLSGAQYRNLAAVALRKF